MIVATRDQFFTNYLVSVNWTMYLSELRRTVFRLIGPCFNLIIHHFTHLSEYLFYNKNLKDMSNFEFVTVLKLWCFGRENGLGASTYSVDYTTLEGSIHIDYGVKGIPRVVQCTICTTIEGDPKQP